MIQALLLDLDDTVLRSDMDTFLPAYTKLLSEAFAEHADPDLLVAQLMAATQAMIANLDPKSTLKETFDRRFYPAIGLEEMEMRPTVERFYAERYPELVGLTEPMEGAVELVEFAHSAGLRIVIATNPLFPLTAIEQRLAWAGFSPEGWPFEFATAYETFHFSKPHPAYYAEILGLLGLPPQDAALIGDNPANDLEPAAALGLAAYHLSETPEEGIPGGGHEEATDWLKGLLAEETDREPPASPAGVLGQARGHLAALLTVMERHPGVPLDHRPSPREWAPVEILCHLRDTEREVHLPRFKRLITESSPFISAVDSDQWAEERRYLDQDAQAGLDGFVSARQESIAQLASFPEDAWASPARHALFGPTTLAEIAALAVNHDILHLAQLHQTFNSLLESGA